MHRNGRPVMGLGPRTTAQEKSTLCVIISWFQIYVWYIRLYIIHDTSDKVSHHFMWHQTILSCHITSYDIISSHLILCHLITYYIGIISYWHHITSQSHQIGRYGSSQTASSHISHHVITSHLIPSHRITLWWHHIIMTSHHYLTSFHTSSHRIIWHHIIWHYIWHYSHIISCSHVIPPHHINGLQVHMPLGRVEEGPSRTDHKNGEKLLEKHNGFAPHWIVFFWKCSDNFGGWWWLLLDFDKNLGGWWCLLLDSCIYSMCQSGTSLGWKLATRIYDQQKWSPSQNGSTFWLLNRIRITSGFFLTPICSHNFQSTHAPHMFSFKVEIHLEHQAVLLCTSIAQGGTQSATVRNRHGSWHTRVFSKAAQRSMCFGALGHQPSVLIMDVVEGNGRCWRKWKRGWMKFIW